MCTVGEASGKASKGLAKHIPGAGGMQHLQQQAGAIGGEFGRTRQVIVIMTMMTRVEIVSNILYRRLFNSRGIF